MQDQTFVDTATLVKPMAQPAGCDSPRGIAPVPIKAVQFLQTAISD